jgi:outer membrane biosynthesis protein TonB
MARESNYEEPGFLQRYGFVIGIGAVVAGVAALVLLHHNHGAPSREIRPPEIVMVRPLPQQPTPPPPEPPKEVIQKMVEQTPMDRLEEKPDDAPKDPSPAISTNVTGSGSDAFGLSGGGGGRGAGGGGGPHSHFGWYAGQVQQLVQEALSRNRVLGQAEFSDRVKIWADATGRVIKIKLEQSTGSVAIDQAISDALEGLQLREPPPGDMPMPILMRIVARRQN